MSTGIPASAGLLGKLDFIMCVCTCYYMCSKLYYHLLLIMYILGTQNAMEEPGDQAESSDEELSEAAVEGPSEQA